MNELHIAGIIAQKRRERGITQEELAEHMGVSKAAVSKWENGQSYPDISLLPLLATYFNISVDGLLGHAPQLSLAQIRKMCRHYSATLTNEPFDVALPEFRAAIRKYYSCFPFVFHMAVLLLNHYPVFPEERRAEVMEEAKGLFARIVADCGDAILAHDALNLQAQCCIVLGQHEAVFGLLGESLNTASYYEGRLIAKAFLMAGNTAKAREVHQCDVYKFLLHLAESLMDYLHFLEGDFERAKTVFDRAMEMIHLWDIGALNPNTVVKAYLLGANMYCKHGDVDAALALLEKYADFCNTQFFPFQLRGDAFFSEVGGWLAADESGAALIDEEAVQVNMLYNVTELPAFAVLKDDPRYMSIVDSLKSSLACGAPGSSRPTT